MSYTLCGFSDGMVAIQRDGQDILHLRRTDQETTADEQAEAGWHEMDEAEFTSIMDAIETALKGTDEIARLRAGLDRLAHPNWGVKPTGQDARDMAAFARSVLRGENA